MGIFSQNRLSVLTEDKSDIDVANAQRDATEKRSHDHNLPDHRRSYKKEREVVGKENKKDLGQSDPSTRSFYNKQSAAGKKEADKYNNTTTESLKNQQHKSEEQKKFVKANDVTLNSGHKAGTKSSNESYDLDAEVFDESFLEEKASKEFSKMVKDKIKKGETVKMSQLDGDDGVKISKPDDPKKPIEPTKIMITD